jgi:histidine triad (HIT) family protein
MDCLFCKIIQREIPASIVYEDDRVLAFNDINPQASTHVLVVPKKHIGTLNDLQSGDDAIVGEVVRRAAAIAEERGIAAGGYRTGIQYQPRCGADRVSHSPAPDRRPQSLVAARITSNLAARTHRRRFLRQSPGTAGHRPRN